MTSAYSQQASNNRKTWLLIILFVGLVSTLFYGLSAFYNEPGLAVIGLVLSLGQAFVAYFFGDSVALSVNGAQEVTEQEAPQLHLLVDNLSKVAGIPKPRVFVSPDRSANAFACGRDPEHASICFNQGILDLLNKNELEGVIAHELSHVKNRDILIMTVTMVLASIISFVSDIGLRMMIWGGNRKDDNNNSGNPILIVVYVLVLILAPFISFFIQMAVSRSREYQADATAVVLTRYPDGLINALKKLYASPIPTEHYSTAMNHFFISPPKKSFGQEVNSLFSTHPSIEDRIAALKQMGSNEI